MNSSKNFRYALSAAFLAAFTGIALANGDGGGGGGPDTSPAPLPDRSIEREYHAALFRTAWSKGLPIADIDGNGKVNGEDMDAFSAALRADMNGDSRLDAADIPAMFEAWIAGDDSGDVNADGGVDGGDIEALFVALDAFSLPSSWQLHKALKAAGIESETTYPSEPDGQ